MNADTILSVLQNYGSWGALVFVFLVIAIEIIRNPTFIPAVVKLIDHFKKKRKKDIKQGEYNLFKLTRTQSHVWIRIGTIATTISDAFLLSTFGFLVFFIWVNKPPQGINAGAQLFLAFLFLFPIVSLIDTYAYVNSSLNLELDGDYNKLLRFCQKRLFDVGARITQFNIKTGDITASIYGSELTFKIEKLKNTHNRLTLNSHRRFIGVFLYSTEYRELINNLVRDLCYNPP